MCEEVRIDKGENPQTLWADLLLDRCFWPLDIYCFYEKHCLFQFSFPLLTSSQLGCKKNRDSCKCLENKKGFKLIFYIPRQLPEFVLVFLEGFNYT